MLSLVTLSSSFAHLYINLIYSLYPPISCLTGDRGGDRYEWSRGDRDRDGGRRRDDDRDRRYNTLHSHIYIAVHHYLFGSPQYVVLSFFSFAYWLVMSVILLSFFLSLSLSHSLSLSLSLTLFLSLSFSLSLSLSLLSVLSSHLSMLCPCYSFIGGEVVLREYALLLSPLTECTASYHLLQCGREKTGRNGTK